MYILTRKNRVIDYCEEGYQYVGNVVVCESKGCNFEDATIVNIGSQSLPADIDGIPYDYIHGEFVKSETGAESALPLIVEFDSTNKIANHTFTEVYDAIQAGREVLGKLNSIYYSTTEASPDGVVFNSIDTTRLGLGYIVYDSANTFRSGIRLLSIISHHHDEKYAPAYTYGTTEIEAGSTSTAATGTLHFVYE